MLHSLLTASIKRFHNISNVMILYRDYILSYKKFLILNFLCIIVVAISTSSLGYIIKPVINKVFIEKSSSQLFLVCGLYLGISFLKGFAGYFNNILTFLIQESVLNQLREEIFKRLVHLKVSSIDKTGHNRILTIFTNDLTIISENFASVFLTIIRDCLTVLFLIMVVFYQNFTLAFIALFLFPLALFPLRKIAKSVRHRYKTSQEKQDLVTNSLNEALVGIKTLKAYCAENFEIKRFNLLLKYLFRYSFGFKQKGAFSSPFMEVVGGISTTLVILYGGLFVIEGKSDVGSFFSFLISLIMAYKPAKGLSGLGMKTQAVNISLGRVFSLLNSGEIENSNKIQKSDMVQFQSYGVEFKNVSFSYSGLESEHVLKNISFKIKQGQKVAFVGSSGSGKSTIADLLMKFYTCKDGSITIGGTDISQLSTNTIRNQIGYATQDSFLFSGSINDNIRYNIRRNPKDIIGIKEKFNVDFEDSVPQEHEYFRTLKLSVGQRQRIGLARAVFKDSNILILDESTSALDMINEREIIDQIFAMKDKTVLMIAHRIHILTGCDWIYVLDNGQIVESGPHEELLQKNGYYKNLWDAML